jgi:hypothetical protein
MSKISRFEQKYVTTSQDNKIQRIRVTYDNLISSNGVGVINTVIGMDPSVSTEWGSVSALYDEFRVMGVRVYLVSRQQGSVTAATDMTVIAYDNNTSAALSSLAQGCQFATSYKFNAIWSHQANGRENSGNCLVFSFMRPTAGKDTAIAWVNTALPSGSDGSVKFYCANLTNSIAYMSYNIEYFIELRGRN